MIKILIKIKFYTAEEVSRINTEDLPLPTHEYTFEEFSESDNDDVDTVLMPCPLDEREELHLPGQIIDDTSLFAVNVTSDVSKQEQESQIDDGHPAQSASSNQILLLLKIIDTIKIDIGKRNQKMQLMLVNSKLLKDQFQIILQAAPILLIYF